MNISCDIVDNWFKNESFWHRFTCKISEWGPHKRHQCASERPKRPAADCRPCFAGHESFSITQWLEYHSALFSSALRPAIFVLLALLPKPALYPVPKFTVVPVWLCWFYCNLRAFYSKKKRLHTFGLDTFILRQKCALNAFQDFLSKLGIKPPYASIGKNHFFTKSCYHQTA